MLNFVTMSMPRTTFLTLFILNLAIFDQGQGQGQDLDPCSRWPPVCSQTCIRTTGGFRCECISGYHLDKDQHHCRADSTNAPTFLVYNQGASIFKIDLTPNNTWSHPVLLHRAHDTVTAIAWDSNEGQVFFYDHHEVAVHSILLHNGEKLELRKNVLKNGLIMVSSLAYDWVGSNLYVADISLHSIFACSVRNDHCIAVKRDLVGMPRSIAVHPIAGKLFWSECGSRQHRIMVSNLDGTDSRVFVKDQILCATSLRVDMTTDSIYWTDVEMHLVESMKLDGSGRRNLTSAYIVHPIGVDVFEDNIYWTSTSPNDGSSFIARANKFDVVNNHPEVVLPYLPEMTAEVHFCHPVLQPRVENECSSNPCSDICLITGNQKFSCACPHGRKLETSGRSCHTFWKTPSLLLASKNRLLRLMPNNVGEQTYDIMIMNGEHNITAMTVHWSSETLFIADSYGTKIGLDGQPSSRGASIARVPLNSPSDAATLFTDLGHVTAMAFDWLSHNIYWVDNEKRVIEVARMDGSARMIIIGGDRVGSPRAVAVDPVESHLFYSDCGQNRSRIVMCDLSGKYCTPDVFSAPVKCISDLFFDVRDGTLYWTDSGRGVIAAVHLATKLVVPIRHSPEPMSLAVASDYLYWTDEHYKDVFYQKRGDAEHGVQIHIGLESVGAIVAMDGYTQPEGFNGCTHVNGGCSHLCIQTAQQHRRCFCPSDMHLNDDKTTCRTNEGNPGKNSNLVHQKKNITSGPFHHCPLDYCPPGVACFAFGRRVYQCICPEGMNDRRCEIKNYGRGLSEAPDDSSSHGWIVGLVASIIAVVMIIVCIYFYVKSKRQLRPGQPLTSAHFKSVVFGSNQDKDKKTLVKEDRQNSAFVNVSLNRPRNLMATSRSLESIPEHHEQIVKVKSAANMQSLAK